MSDAGGADVEDVDLYDPYEVGNIGGRAFWADAVADAILASNPDEPIVIKGGVSPSGVPHIGHFNEILRSYFVAEALRDRGHEVRQVFSTDDKDPLRKIPRTLADLEWNIVDFGDDAVDSGAVGQNLGKPYTDIPDPFGCCDSYGAHFTELLEQSADLVDVPVEFVSNTDLYADGEFEAITRDLLEHTELARETLSAYQASVDDAYVPFTPQCQECGLLTGQVVDVDLEAGTVEYVCSDMEAGDRTIEGCGHEGTATFRDGKLPWRFEWPAQWEILGVDFEPFGKDHAEGSWPSGLDIARNVLDIEPPVPMVYEWFTLNGEALSSSAGNIVTVAEVLDLLEPEVFRYFFTKNPRKQRDFDVTTLDQLVDEFDRFERVYFGETTPVDPDEKCVADRAYPMAIGSVEYSMTDGRKYRTIDYQSDIGDHLSYRAAVRYNDGTVSYNSELDAPIVPDDIDVSEGLLTSLARLDDEFGLSDVAIDGYINRAFSPEREPVNKQRDALLDIVFSERQRIPYRFAAVLGMTDNRSLRVEMANREGHLSHDAPTWVTEAALDRVERARRWAKRTDNEYNYRLAEDLPETDFEAATEAALDELADFVEAGHDGEEIQGEIYEAAKRNDVEVADFFAAGYRLFLDTDQGPRLGPFLAALDEQFVLDRLRRNE